jgi:hypothetical protein
LPETRATICCAAGEGDDTYQFGLGDGQDAIEDASGANVVELGRG